MIGCQFVTLKARFKKYISPQKYYYSFSLSDLAHLVFSTPVMHLMTILTSNFKGCNAVCQGCILSVMNADVSSTGTVHFPISIIALTCNNMYSLSSRILTQVRAVLCFS